MNKYHSRGIADTPRYLVGEIPSPYPCHWATYLIGKPYKKDAVGPDEFDCVGFTEYVLRTHKGIDMPLSAIKTKLPDNEDRIREAARRSGYRPVLDKTHVEDDVMLMENIEGPHIGIVIRSNAKWYLMHCVDGIGVCLMPLYQLEMVGYKNIRSWRRQC